jgi:soluble lytic murein transglycosylase-like protein
VELLIIAGAVALLFFYEKNKGTTAPEDAEDAQQPQYDPGATVDEYGPQSDPLSSIAAAVAHFESGGRQVDSQGNVITSSAGAVGIMQLMPSTAAGLGVDPYNADDNQRGGTLYLQQLYARFGNWHDALAAYNWGPGNVNKALSSGSSFPQSVENYVSNIAGYLGGLPESNVG